MLGLRGYIFWYFRWVPDSDSRAVYHGLTKMGQAKPSHSQTSRIGDSQGLVEHPSVLMSEALWTKSQTE